MALKETCKEMCDLLGNICIDLQKAEMGNKAASQRVRTRTIRLEKVAKRYRKESIASERKGGSGSKRAAKKAPQPKAKKKAGKGKKR